MPEVAVDLDPRMTFDTFVVGPGNRLASAAARRAADSPAASYNPLFLYSASGLGKSHILNAMAHHSERLNPDARVQYQTLEGYLAELTEALSQGREEAMRERYKDLDILLLDDVQFLTGQPQAQEILLRTLDALNLSGSQIVLASDRPPAEIDGLDARLLSRFSGGLMVDISPPEFETRLAITRRLRQLRGVTLDDKAAEAVARLPYRNVRELMGGLNRILAIQDLEGRVISADEVGQLVEVPRERNRRGGQGGGGQTISAGAEPDFEEPWQTQLREAAEVAESEGFNAIRLRRMLASDIEPSNTGMAIGEFQEIIEQLRFIQSELDVVGNPWPEAARGVLTDPERLEEARALLASARERVRSFPPFRTDRSLEDLERRFPPLALKAAHDLCGDDAPEYNPLYVWSADGYGARELLEATGTSYLKVRPTARTALISAQEFAEEFVNALSEGVAGAWRERWWTVELLMVHEAQELAHTERAQDEFFHLFEAVKRRGARILIASDRSPRGIRNIDDRLRSRFEGGLVVPVEVKGEPPLPMSELLTMRDEEPEVLATDLSGLDGGVQIGPDDPLLGGDPDGSVVEGNAEEDAGFQSTLDELAAGSAEHAMTVDDDPDWEGPQPLTQIKISPENFPTLLTEKERFFRETGVPLEEASAPKSPEPGEKPTEAPQPATADLLDPGPVTSPPQTPSETAAPFDAPLPVSELSDIIDAILAPFDAHAVPKEPPPAGAAPGSGSTEAAAPSPQAWQPSPEKVVWDWPALTDRVVGERD